MKCFLLPFLVAVLCAATTTAADPVASHMAVEGAASDGTNWLVAAGPPFFDYFAGGGLNVTITSPNESATYYSNTHNLTANITGGSENYTCEYRINGNAWNVWDCVNQQVTFPQGEVVLTVRAYDDDGNTGSDTIRFTIVLFSETGGGGRLLFLFAPVALALFFVLFDDGDERWRRMMRSA